MTLKKIAEFYAGIAHAEAKTNDTGSGFDSHPAYCAASRIEDAIRTAILPPELVAEIERDRRDALRWRAARDGINEYPAVFIAQCSPHGVAQLSGELADLTADTAIDAIAGKAAGRADE